MKAAGSLALAILLATGAARAELLPEGDCAGVYWDLTARFETGDQLYARVLLSRAGPGARGAAAQGHWIDPSGVQTPFQNGRRDGRFTLEADGRSLRIGSSSLDLASDPHAFEVDNDKRGVKLRVELPANEAVAAPVQAGALAIDVLHLGSAARGRVWRRGMDAARAASGRATLVRTVHVACEADLVDARVDVHQLAGEGAAALLVHERLREGASRSWLGWRDTGGTLHALRPGAFAFEGWREVATGDRLPQQLRPKGHELTGAIEIGQATVAFDPLDALPRLVRMLYWFGGDPRRIWSDARSELSIASDASKDSGGASASPPRGPAVASFTFLRPPAPSHASGPPDSGG